MESLVVIPALGGSGAVPGRDLQVVGGLPLVARAVRTARAARRAGRLAVCAGDPDIARIASAEGAQVVGLPGDALGAESPVEAALLYTIETLRRDGYEPEAIALLDCAAPLARAADVDGTLEVLEARRADTALAAAVLDEALWTGDPGSVAPAEARPRYVEARSVYAMRAEGFRKHRRRFFGKTAVYLVEKDRVLRIESPGDLYRARQLVGEPAVSLEEHPVIYVDIDETICITPPGRDYHKAVPIAENIAAVNRLFEQGHRIVYWTARGGKSGVDYTELTRSQLEAWGARYHSLLTGKPSYDLLICDKATRRVPFVG